MIQLPEVVVLSLAQLYGAGIVISIVLFMALLHNPYKEKPPSVSVAAAESVPTTPSAPGSAHTRRTAAHAIATLGQETLAEMTAIRKRRKAGRAEHGELTPEEAAFLDGAIADQLASVQADYARRVRALKEEHDDY